MSVLTNAIVFLIKVCFESYIYCLLLRLLLQKFCAPFHNPISQFLIKLTDPLVKPFRKVIPGFKGFDMAIVLLVVIFQVLELMLIIGLQFHTIAALSGTLVIMVAQLCNKLINIFFFAILISAVMSWFPAMRMVFLLEIVTLLALPILKPIQRILPLVGGFDLSPLIAILVLQLISMLFVNPLIYFGFQLAF